MTEKLEFHFNMNIDDGCFEMFDQAGIHRGDIYDVLAMQAINELQDRAREEIPEAAQQNDMIARFARARQALAATTDTMPDGYMLVRKPVFANPEIADDQEYVCCGGYTPCRGTCVDLVTKEK